MISLTGSNVTIMVTDMDRSIKFYLALGLTLQQRWDNHYAMVSGPGITIGIHPTAETNTTSGTISIGFMVSDIDEARATLEGLGVSYREDKGKSGHYLHFKDNDETQLYFVLPAW